MSEYTQESDLLEKLQNGLDPSSVNNMGLSALHTACRYGWTSVISYIIKEIMNESNRPYRLNLLSIQDCLGHTPLMELILGGCYSENSEARFETFKKLINLSTIEQLRIKDFSGCALIHHCARHFKHKEISILLIKDINREFVYARIGCGNMLFGDALQICSAEPAKPEQLLTAQVLLDAGFYPDNGDPSAKKSAQNEGNTKLVELFSSYQ